MDLNSIQIYNIKSGDIKVNAGELALYIQMKEGLIPVDDSFREYFVKKYLELPDIRMQEQLAYEYLQRARELVKNPEDEKTLRVIEQNYLEIRSKRIELSENLKREQGKYTLEGRLTSEPESGKESPRQEVRKERKQATMYRRTCR